MEPSDQLLIELEEQERWRDLLGEVLAVLNRDGGHYQTKHGAGRAAIEGIRSHYQIFTTIDALQAENARLREQAEALAAALAEAGPPVFLQFSASGTYFECCHCQGAGQDRETVGHDGECQWLPVVAALRAYRGQP